jgi:hypothetical protein
VPQRTWVENDSFDAFLHVGKKQSRASPGFPVKLVAPVHFMRLSLKKAAYAVVSSAAYRKSGSPRRFHPRYALANLGHPSVRGREKSTLLCNAQGNGHAGFDAMTCKGALGQHGAGWIHCVRRRHLRGGRVRVGGGGRA